MTVKAPAADHATIAHAQRVAGQAAAVAGMVSAGRPYPEVVQQLLATRGSLDSLLVRIVEHELTQVTADGSPDRRVERVIRIAFDRSHRAPHRARGVNQEVTHKPITSERTVS